MTSTTLLILMGFAAALLWLAWRARPDPVQIAAARQALSRGATLIDVRTAAEFRSGHISGARNLPLASLGERLSAVGGTETEIVLCCASGSRSRAAASLLRQAGYGQVHDAGAMRHLR